MSGFWLSPIKEDICEEEEMTILDYNNEFKQTQNKEDIIKFSNIVKKEDFLLNQEVLTLNNENILIKVLNASRFFYSPKQEYLRLFFEGFVLAFFEDEPQYKSHIKRKLKMKDVKNIQQLDHDKIRLEFAKKDFIEFQILKETNISESIEEVDDEGEIIVKVEITPKMVIEGLKSILEFLNTVNKPNQDTSNTVNKNENSNKTDNKKKEKLKSILKLTKEINSVTNLDKRQSAMYINRHSRDEFMEVMDKSQLAAIDEEGEGISEEKILFMRSRKIFRALKMADKDFLELDLQIHASLEQENEMLQGKISKNRKKFLKATKPLQKVLKYGEDNQKRDFSSKMF
jgi:hypothetical protein